MFRIIVLLLILASMVGLPVWFAVREVAQDFVDPFEELEKKTVKLQSELPLEINDQISLENITLEEQTLIYFYDVDTDAETLSKMSNILHRWDEMSVCSQHNVSQIASLGLTYIMKYREIGTKEYKLIFEHDPKHCLHKKTGLALTFDHSNQREMKRLTREYTNLLLPEKLTEDVILEEVRWDSIVVSVSDDTLVAFDDPEIIGIKLNNALCGTLEEEERKKVHVLVTDYDPPVMNFIVSKEVCLTDDYIYSYGE